MIRREKCNGQLEILKKRIFCLRNWVFATNFDFLIPISLQHNLVNLRYFKLYEICQINKSKFEISKVYTSSCTDIWTRKFQFGIKDLIPNFNTIIGNLEICLKFLQHTNCYFLGILFFKIFLCTQATRPLCTQDTRSLWTQATRPLWRTVKFTFLKQIFEF